MAPHAFKDMGAPTISSDNIYTWKEGPIVKITKDSFTVTRMGKKGKFAALDVNPNFKPNPKMRAKYFGRDVEEDQWVGSLLSFQNETKYIDIESQEDKELIVVANEEQIEIKFVYLGQGNNICTLSVACVIYALLDYLNNNENIYPEHGKVYISSSNGCAAFNCYNRAFRMNGYSLTPKSFNDYERYIKYGTNEDLRITLEFHSQEQSLKSNIRKDMEGISMYRMFVQKLQDDKRELEQLPILGPIGTIPRASADRKRKK